MKNIIKKGLLIMFLSIVALLLISYCQYWFCKRQNKVEMPELVEKVYKNIKDDKIINSLEGVHISPRGYYLVSIDSLNKFYMVENGIITKDFNNTKVLSKDMQQIVNNNIKNTFNFMKKNNIVSIDGRGKNIEFNCYESHLLKCNEHYVLIYNKHNIEKTDIDFYKSFHPYFRIIDKNWGLYEQEIRVE